MANNVVEVSDSSFDTEVLQSTIPVLLDFWAPWCPPCKAIAPVIEQLAGEYNGKLKVAKMNVDENPRTPTQYKVQGIPKLIFFKGGQVVEQLVGARPKEELVDAIKKII